MASDSKKSRIVLALDLVGNNRKTIMTQATNLIVNTSNSIVAVKLNYHLLLPLSEDEIREIVELSHQNGLQVIADMKLNDIGSTNLTVASYLWKIGFDGIIANPIAGYDDALEPLIDSAHTFKKGVILLVYMSHAGAKETYGIRVLSRGQEMRLYEEFLDRAISWDADGIIVGGTHLDILREASQKVNGRLNIFSPGAGKQGGDVKLMVESGADYIIVGRSIINARNPVEAAMDLHSRSWTQSTR